MCLAAPVRILGVIAGGPPTVLYPDSDHYSSFIYPSLVICAVLAPLAYVSVLAGVVYVAKNADSLFKNDGERFGQGERLDSIDLVLMDRDPRAAHDLPSEQDARAI